jgi:hypothetical protein
MSASRSLSRRLEGLYRGEGGGRWQPIMKIYESILNSLLKVVLKKQ